MELYSKIENFYNSKNILSLYSKIFSDNEEQIIKNAHSAMMKEFLEQKYQESNFFADFKKKRKSSNILIESKQEISDLTIFVSTEQYQNYLLKQINFW